MKPIAHLMSIVALATTLATAAVAADIGSVTVAVNGARNDKGVIRIAVYTNKEAYGADKANTGNGAVRKEAVPIKGGQGAYTFQDLPYGEYAIKLFHDEDNSGKFYTGTFGIPKVQYGFSNNAKGMMGPASFAKAAFKLKSANLTQSIELSK